MEVDSSLSKKNKTDIDFYSLVKQQTREFCLDTSIHGFQYIAQIDKSVLTRFVWTFMVGAICVAAYCFIYFAYLYNTLNLTSTVSDTIFNPIWEYPFPGVTICNINKISIKRAKEFSKKIKPDNMSLDEVFKLTRHLVQLQYSYYYPQFDDEYETLQRILDERNITAEQAIFTIRPECSDLIFRCMWKGKIWNCEGLFQESRSSLGICCSVNSFHFRNTTFSKIFLEKQQPKPTRISACGSNSGLKVIVKNNPDDYFVGETPTYGTKVLIHDPVDFPGYAAQNAIVPAGSNYFITVSPILTYATDSYKDLPYENRGCILDYERPMVIFNNYSWVNCLTECRIVMTYLACGCTPFFLRNVDVDWIPNNKACSLREIKCIAEYKHYFINSMPELTFPFPDELFRNACYCPPECEARQFFIETSRATLSRKYSVNEKSFYAGIHTQNFSVVNVYFKDLVATRTKRDLSITWYTQLALIGGLLGLCFGFSFTSGFEILYSFTIKMILGIIERKNKIKPIKNKNPMRHETFKSFSQKNMAQISIINFTKNKQFYGNNINKDNLWFN